MATKRIISSRLDRRIRLEKPSTVRDEYNEEQTEWVLVAANIPASKVETPAGDESLEGSLLRSEHITEWEMRYMGSIVPRSTWRITDENGTMHEILFPPAEIERRVGWRFRTRVLQ